MDATGEWAVRFPGHGGVVFCLVMAGTCIFQTVGRDPQGLVEGDFLLMNGPAEWTLGDKQATHPRDYAKVDGGEDVQVVCIGDGACALPHAGVRRPLFLRRDELAFVG